MDCQEVARKLREGGELDGAHRAHLDRCASCAALVSVAASLPASSAPSLDLSSALASTRARIAAETGFGARLRGLPTWARIGAVAGVAAVLWIVVAIPSRRPPDPEFPVPRLAALLATFAIFTVAMLHRTFADLHGALRTGAIVSAGCVALFALDPLLPEASSALESQGAFFGDALKCFIYGWVTGAPIALLAFAFDRRERFSWVTGWRLGAIGALSGLAVLALHCPIVDRSHLVAGHTLSALGLVAVSAAVLTFKTSRRHR